MTKPFISVTSKVTLEGDFFRRDPGKTVRQNIRDMLDALAEWMESTVEGEIRGKAGAMPYYTGWTADTISGYTTSPSTGKRWQLHAAVTSLTKGMSAKDAIRTKAAAATIERRFHPFRRIKSGVYRARPLINANLTEGLDG